MKKVSVKYNNKKRFKLTQTNNINSGVSADDITSDENDIEIISSNKNSKYTKINKSYYRMLVPYAGQWGNIIIGDVMCDYGWYSTPKNETDNLSNKKTYMESKLITYLTITWSIDYSPKQTYDFLRELPKIDFNKTWTDEELYKEFNLTEEEINEVETWYSNWVK